MRETSTNRVSSCVVNNRAFFYLKEDLRPSARQLCADYAHLVQFKNNPCK